MAEGIHEPGPRIERNMERCLASPDTFGIYLFIRNDCELKYLRNVNLTPPGPAAGTWREYRRVIESTGENRWLLQPYEIKQMSPMCGAKLPERIPSWAGLLANLFFHEKYLCIVKLCGRF